MKTFDTTKECEVNAVPGIFPSTAIYSTLVVTNALIQGECLITQVVYFDRHSIEVGRIDITYTDDLHPIWLGQVLKDHKFNAPLAMFELFTGPKDEILNTRTEISLNAIKKELQELNTYFAIMMDNKI